jgi:hypothetical protein
MLFSWDFSQGTFGWQAGFADYPLGEENFYQLNSGWEPLPANLGGESALFITGDNRSDDLFMYFRNFVSGLSPNTNYLVNFSVELASNAPDGSIGIGGSPGNSVYLKAGATPVEPLANVINPNSNFVELNIDKGFQSQSGADSVVLGDIAKPDDGTFDYAIISRDNRDRPFNFQTDDSGDAWLYFGTDSGFEGTTALYYTNFRAQFRAGTQSISIPEPSNLYLIVGVGLFVLMGWLRKKFIA